MKTIALLIIVSCLSSVELFAQQSKSGPFRPVGVNTGITDKNPNSVVVIDGVPSYLWFRGCGPTSLGMVVGYYDTHGFSDLIEGDASTQTGNVDDAIADSAHYCDYSLPLDYYPNLLQDKSDLGGAHISDCMADFMKTSWSSDENYWGWSWAVDVAPAFTNYVHMKDSGYIVTTSYEYFSIFSSWNVYKNEIDNNRPVELLVDSDGNGSTDHFVAGIGYDDVNLLYGIYDTWDNTVHWYQFRAMSNTYPWGIYGFNLFEIQLGITASANPNGSGTISGAGGYNWGETAILSANAQPGYDFVN